MPRSAFRPLLVRALPGLVAFLAASSTAAAGWAESAGGLGHPESRIALFFGGNYGVMSGSEVERTDPTLGFEGGARYRIFPSLCVSVSYAYNAASVSGQLVEILDTRVRENWMSGNVEGDLENSRVRLGARFDGLAREGWRYHPYLELGALFSMLDVTIDTVDGQIPRPFPQSPDEAPSSIRTIDDTQWGGAARFGIETDLTDRIAFDLGTAFEIIEFPPGTNSVTTLGGRLTYRL